MFEEKTLELKTSCKDCVFAIFTGNEQIACELGRFKIFKDNGDLEIVEGSGIINAFCNTCRSKDWADKQECTSKAWVDQVLQEVQIRTEIIIADYENTPLADLQTLLKKNISNILQSAILPKKILFISNSAALEENIQLVISDVQQLTKDTGVNYDIIVHKEQIPVFERLVDIASKNIKSTYFIPLKLGQEIPRGLIKSLNIALNHDLKKFIMVTDDILPTVYHTKLYKMVGGNRGHYVEDKIQKLVASQHKENMILTWNNILCQTP